MFGNHLAAPLEKMTAERSQALAAENSAVFREQKHVDHLPDMSAPDVGGTGRRAATQATRAATECAHV